MQVAESTQEGTVDETAGGSVMTENLVIIDMHSHLQRDAKHSAEIRDYFLPRGLVKPDTPNLGTLDEFKDIMKSTGIARTNFLMFTWAGKYYRDGLHVLPDEPTAREREHSMLRQRVTRRIVDNNEWAIRTVEENPEFSFFAGINPVVMDEDVMLAEIVDKIGRGALGIKIVPLDMQIGGSDRLLFPAYEYCEEHGIPLVTETGVHSPGSNPLSFSKALDSFPDLKIIFAHMGHNPVFGEGTDLGVVELASQYPGVCTDTSLRLHEVADGLISPEAMVAHIRRIGTDRVMFGSNYVFCDLFPKGPHHVAPPDGVDSRFAEVWKSVQVLETLPLTDSERVDIASGNFCRFTGLRLS